MDVHKSPWSILIIPVILIAGMVVVVLLQQGVNTEHREQVATVTMRLDNLAAYAEASNELIHLPEDGNGWHISFFLHDDWEDRPDEQEKLSWFFRDPRLIKLRTTEAHSHIYTPSSPLYQKRFAHTVPQLPAFMIQDAKGKAHYKVGHTKPWPRTAREMGDQVEQIFRRPWICPRPRPQPTPAPTPTPEPTPDDRMPDVPDVTPDDIEPAPALEETGELSTAAVLGIAFVIFVAAGALALVYKIRTNSE